MKSFDQQLADWARTKPADEAYEFSNCGNCALAQFLRATGRATDPLVGIGQWTSKDAGTPWYEYPAQLDDALSAEPWTFGALADRLAATLAQGQAA